MSKENSYSFRLLTPEDELDTIVRMHKTTFYNVISGQIGNEFLFYYYKLVVVKGFIFGCYKKNELLGFVAGTTNENELLNDKGLSKKAFQGLLRNLSPSLILSLLRHFKRGLHLKRINIHAELLSIITSEKLRGQGIGKVLLDKFDNYMISHNIKEYKVYTEINVSEGYKFYEKYGFSKLTEMNLFGLKARLYRKGLS
jgi:ribosomal protein S18 acetylase RimI-like enzyme